MVALHSDPSSGGGTGTLCLTARHYTPTRSVSTRSTPTATLSGVSAKLSTLTPIYKPREDEEHEEKLDVEAELRADGDNPFPIDRRAVKEVLQDKMAIRIDRIRFLSSGTFHKAFLLYLDPKHTDRHLPSTLVFRIARRTMHMPRLKTESEVATLAYLRTRTSVPVPTVYHYDAYPYNVLGGEWMVMSKAPGLPLSKFYHNLSQTTLRALLSNLARMLIPLFEHRFSQIGSLYFAADASQPGAVPLTDGPSSSSLFTSPAYVRPGPIISYPFFGSSRGLLSHTSKPTPEISRGPWDTFPEYLAACAQREIDGVIREGQGKEVGRRPRVAPVSEAGSDSSSSGSEDEDDWGVNWNGVNKSRVAWSGPSSFGSGGGGDALRPRLGSAAFDDEADADDSDSASSGTAGDHESYYRDYRATQRSTFLVAHVARREASVREEMGVFMEVMTALREEAEGGLGLGEFGERGKRRRRGSVVAGGGGEEEEEDVAGEEAFTLDCHDLSLENVFVDEYDHSKITCIIDWESTCIRPLFQAAHLPTFLQPHHGHGHHHGHHHHHHHHHHGHGHGHHHHHHSHSHSHHHHRPHMSRTGSHSSYHTPLPRYLPSHAPAAQIFREEVAKLGGRAAARWLALEQAGAKRRWAHRVIEWDGWEEGLAGQILGELEYGWEMEVAGAGVVNVVDGLCVLGEEGEEGWHGRQMVRRRNGAAGVGAGGGDRERERDVSADGGRELGRRLEQWVREGANVASYRRHGEEEDDEAEEDHAACAG